MRQEDINELIDKVTAQRAHDNAKRLLMEAIVHDEQLSIWSEDMQFGLNGHIVGPETYDDGVATHVAFQAEIKKLAESVIDRVLDEQKSAKWRLP